MSAPIEQSVGRFEIAAYTDGWPISIEVRYRQWNGEVAELRCHPSDLEDLRYGINRVLAQVVEVEKERRGR